MRNQLVAIERILSGWKGKPASGGFGEMALTELPLLEKLRADAFPQILGFQKRDLAIFEGVYQGLSPLEKKYFNAFSKFTAREHQLAKIGVQGMSNANGMATLWLSDFDEKQANFDIISHLKVAENRADEKDPFMVFAKTAETNPLANFRVGDIAALYPYQQAGDSVLQSQVFKVTIVELTKEHVKVRLRSRQSNLRIFERNEFWNLEHDMLDSSFVGMYRGLFDFARSPVEKRSLLLTLRAPAEPEPVSLSLPAELTPEQQRIFRKIVASQDYFLLWGPPGTGKTSMMLKHLVKYYLEHTDENLLLLAYTNRAVDEICESMERIGPDIRQQYMRIGSRYGTDDRFQAQLLDEKIEKAGNRAELRDIIADHRIFVATVSSFLGKAELLKLKNFNRVIIDEASQILEPLLMGLLPQFAHFTLIGDHKQMPAVVVQSEESSRLEDATLQALGLDNLRNSLFERLYERCRAEGWVWAYEKLSHQGRMHQEIMRFSNDYFYGGFLQILPMPSAAATRQTRELQLEVSNPASEMQHLLTTRRVLLIPTPPDIADGFFKTNLFEAKKVVEIISCFRQIATVNHHLPDIGVITPYRAQIALIRKELQQSGLDPDEFTIDTVERFQGGARDVIIISLCTNTDSQLQTLSNLAKDGTDRKLNVALTRARDHLILLGCPELLKGNTVYEKLVEWALPG